MLSLNQIYLGDCLEVMKEIDDKSIDLICIDPPYNIRKAQWDKIEGYVDWMGLVFKSCERILKDNGSFYWFHNDMPVIAQLMEGMRKQTRFVFKQFIVWNKRFTEAKQKRYLDGYVVVEGLRNYQQMAEYILFYTFQEATGLEAVKLNINTFGPLREYFKQLQMAIGLNKKQIIGLIGQQADHCCRWGSSQWDMPTPETYEKLLVLVRDKEFVAREYESLRQEYESSKYTFNNKKTHHSVWDYNIANKINGHITPKPVGLVRNIIEHSSNPGDIVFDCFMGSGTTAIAAIRTGRKFIGIERDERYFQTAIDRIEQASKVKCKRKYRRDI